MSKNKKLLNSLIEINKKMLPFFSNPIILKRINDQKKNKDLNSLNPQKKLIYKIIKLNENLVKFTTSIKNYNLNLDLFFLSNIASNKTEFILFTRNNFFYSIKYRLSNIMYKIEKLLPVLKFYSLLNNINLFAPKRLLKPQSYIRFTHSVIQLNNKFKFKKDSSSLPRTQRKETPSGILKNAGLTETLNTDNFISSSFSTTVKKGKTVRHPSRREQKRGNIFGNQPVLERSKGADNLLTMALPTLNSTSLSLKNSKSNLGKIKVDTSMDNTREKVLIKINTHSDQYSNSIIQLHNSENARSIKYFLLKLDNLLNEVENMINIKNKLIKIIKIKNISNLDGNDLELVKSNTSPSSVPLSAHLYGYGSGSSSPKGGEGFTLPTTLRNTYPALPYGSRSEEGEPQSIKEKDELLQHLTEQEQQISGVQINKNLSGSAEVLRPSNQNVKTLRLEIKKINSNNDNINIETYPLLVEADMVKENKIKIERVMQTQPIKSLRQAVELGSVGEKIGANVVFNADKDIINENSNPVDLLYFNNNLKKPVINQYLKSMSTYNMITNGTILYYSNIIGFNFKNRVRAYLPFIKSISPISHCGDDSSLSTSNPSFLHDNGSSLHHNQKGGGELWKSNSTYVKNGERLTSPYSFRSLRKVVGSLDKGKFSIFGRGIENNKLINNIYKLLYLSFKSMYCLISKPVFIVKSNKIIIQLFYFLLIPKIFKHIKSKTKNKPMKKNRKRIYLNFVEKRKKQALAALFESRLKEKEDAIKTKYFMQYSLNNQLITKGAEQHNNRSNNSIMNLDAKSVPLLNLSYKEEFVKARKAEEKISEVKFDKFGKVRLDSIEYQLEKNPQLLVRNTTPLSPFGTGQSRRSNQRFNLSSSLSLNGVSTRHPSRRVWGTAKLKDKNLKSKNNKIRSYKLLFKRFDFYNINKDLHVLRIPRFWIPFSPVPPFGKGGVAKSKDLKVKFYNNSQYLQLREGGGASDLMQRQHAPLLGTLNRNGNNNRNHINPIRNIKLFKYLALTYLNIFKFKDRRNILNKLKINISSGYTKKELIKNKSYLPSLNSAEQGSGNVGFIGNNSISTERRSVGRNRFNSYNQINWYLFKKLFWSIRLSKKIIPNAKILQKLGIPQWSWPYSGIKKKGYTLSNRTYANKPLLSNLLVHNREAHTTLSYSWPFSLLMSPNIIQVNKENYLSKDNLKNRNLASTASTNDTETQLQQGLLYLKEGLHDQPITTILKEGTRLQSEGRRSQRSGERIPVIQKQNRFKIRELYTKRYHLMKLANINLVKVYPLKFEKLCEVLNSLFNKPVELDLIRLHYPYNDSNILVRLLAFMINKMKLRRITRRLFNKAVVKSIKKINNKDQVNIIPAFLSGMTIKVAGRLMKYKVVPRKTVKIVRRGSSSIGKINYSDISRFTNKNKRGSFTITIKSGQNFFN